MCMRRGELGTEKGAQGRRRWEDSRDGGQGWGRGPPACHPQKLLPAAADLMSDTGAGAEAVGSRGGGGTQTGSFLAPISGLLLTRVILPCHMDLTSPPGCRAAAGVSRKSWRNGGK